MCVAVLCCVVCCSLRDASELVFMIGVLGCCVLYGVSLLCGVLACDCLCVDVCYVAI